MRGLNKIHIKLRKELHPATESAYITLLDDIGSDDPDKDQLVKYAICIGEDEREIERIPLLLTHHKEIEKLKKKNPELFKIERGHFSTDTYN